MVAPKESKISQVIEKPVTTPSETSSQEAKVAGGIEKPATTPSVVAPKTSKISQVIEKPVTTPSETSPQEAKVAGGIEKPATTPSVVAPKESKISQEIEKPVTSPARTSAPKEEPVSKIMNTQFTSPTTSIPVAVKNQKETGNLFTGQDAIAPKAAKEADKPIAGPAAAAPSYEKTGKLHYYEDFSYSQPVVYPSGYKREYVVNYGGRKLQVAVQKEDYIASFDPTKRTFFRDFVVEVDAVQDDGPEDSDYGVILRKSDENNYYRFRISSSGYYGFDKMQDGRLVELVPWSKSSDIRTGKETNLIKVECNGDKFIFGVNGVALGSCSDESFEGGTFGLEVGSHSSGGVRVNFDNLKFYDLA
ncbi:MAG: hypothetical protein A4E48_01818 [Methanosaeta sp. PtaU1.Bin060]|nr:MAG: hypothetical protein A4E48_01818 [Methanosaeta sp. PtaU1.Bin060]